MSETDSKVKEYMDMANEAGAIDRMFDKRARIEILQLVIQIDNITIKELSNIYGEHHETAIKMIDFYKADVLEKIKEIARIKAGMQDA